MRPSPYRTPAERPATDEAPAAESVIDGDIVAIFAILWASALTRVGLAIYSGERFGAGLTLLSMAIVGLTLLAKDSVAALLRRLLPLVRRTDPRS